MPEQLKAGPEMDLKIAGRLGTFIGTNHGIRYQYPGRPARYQWGYSPEYAASEAALYREQGIDCEYVTQNVAPPYSTDIDTAWELVEHLRGQGWLVTVKVMPDGFPFRDDESNQIHVRAVVELLWMPLKDREDMAKSVHTRPFAVGDTAPEAICRAYLAVMEGG